MRKIIPTQAHYLIQYTFNPAITEAIKRIPGRRFHYQTKAWSVPLDARQHIDDLARRYNFIIQEPGGNNQAKAADLHVPPLPELEEEPDLKMQLYPFQKQGVAYMLQKRKAINGAQPGLGKTAMAIAAIHAAQAYPCLVICPNSLKTNWQREWAMWTGERALILSDNIKTSWPYLLRTGIARVFIVNFESLKKYFVDEIRTPKNAKLLLSHIKFSPGAQLFSSLVVDESHRVKDAKTQQSKFTRGLAIGKEMVLLLTGTPVVNKPQDLISQLAIIDQLGTFGGYSAFMRRYVNDDRHYQELNALLRQRCFVRWEKKEVLTELPDKIRQKVLCEITTRREYKDAMADLEEYLKRYKQATDDQIKKSLKGEVMVRIGILKNISARGKIADASEYISDVIETGEKIIIFVHLKEVAAAVKTIYPGAVTILGDDSTEQRQINIDRFQNDPNTQIIICSIKAAGVGITLTASSRVAFLELPWHPADCEQCEDRAHRIGQKNAVNAVYFLGRGTIDQWIYQVIDQKRQISAQITGTREIIEESTIDAVIELLIHNIFSRESLANNQTITI